MKKQSIPFRAMAGIFIDMNNSEKFLLYLAYQSKGNKLVSHFHFCIVQSFSTMHHCRMAIFNYQLFKS